MTTEERHNGAIRIDNPPPSKLIEIRIKVPVDLRKKIKIHGLQNDLTDSGAVTDILRKYFEGVK